LERVRPFRSVVDLRDSRLFSPEHMPSQIQEICHEAGEPQPQRPGEFFRCVLESLALQYRLTLAEIEAALGQRVEQVHLVGGGVKNRVLCQMAADACGRPVIAGPVEATAIGNLAVQMIAVGELASLDEARAVIRASFPLERYESGDHAAWDAAASRLRQGAPA
jgi:rhamnulokinase